jgi:hypothetical protein
LGMQRIILLRRREYAMSEFRDVQDNTGCVHSN